MQKDTPTSARERAFYCTGAADAGRGRATGPTRAGASRVLLGSPLLLFVSSLLVCCGPAGVNPEGTDGGADGGASEVVDPVTQLEALRRLLEENDVRPLEAPPEVSDELFALGQALAFDKVLSGNEDVSCMTCHHPAVGSDDDLHLSLGVGGSGLGADRRGGEVIARNAQPLFNLHLYENMFWDGRVERGDGGSYRTPAGEQLTPDMIATFDFGVVSAQAMFPVTDAHEMRGAPGTNELADLPADDLTGIWAGLMARLGDIPEYVGLFEAAYPGESFVDMNFGHAANAIAAFEIRGFDMRDSPWNRFVQGDDDAISTEHVTNAVLFFEAGCANCHAGSTTSDFEFHALALPQFGPGKGHGPDGNDDYGREGVTGDANDRYDFRTPPLFNVELTAPYGHAGQFIRLDKHIQVYTDLEFWRNTYADSNVSDPSLLATLIDNREGAFAAIEEDLRVAPIFSIRRQDVETPMPLIGKIKDLERFMAMFTDERARDMRNLVPDRVPSGLPVAD